MPKIDVPQMVNIADLKSTPRKPTLLHITAEQWKQATKGATEARSLKKGQSFIQYTPLPDGDGFLSIDCGSPSPDEVCSARWVVDKPAPAPGRPGPGPGPEISSRPGRGLIRAECRCRPKRSGGGGGENIALPPPCNLVIGPEPIRFSCTAGSCAGRCKLTLVRGNQFVFVACVCS